MDIFASIGAVERRLRVIQLLDMFRRVFLWVSVAALCTLGIGYLAPRTALFLFVLALGCIAWRIHRSSPEKKNFRQEASLALDQFFGSKERIVSLLELSADEEKRSLLLSQLSAFTRPVNPGEIATLNLSTRDKSGIALAAVCFLACFIISGWFGNPFRSPNQKAISAIENVLDTQTTLPPEVKKELENLRDALAEESAASQEVLEALKRAESALERAQLQSSESTAGESSTPLESEEPPLEPEKNQGTVKPSPTPTPAKKQEQTAEQQKEEQQKKEEQQQQQSQGGEGEKEEQKEQEQGGQGQEKSEQKQQGQSKDKEKSEEQEQGDGEGQGKEGQGEGKEDQGKGSGKSEKESSSEQGEGSGSGKEQSQGENQKDGKSDSGSQEQQQKGGQSGKEGEQQEQQSGGDGAKEGQQEASALDKAQQALQEARKSIDAQKQESSQGEGKEGAEGQEGQKPQPGSQQNKSGKSGNEPPPSDQKSDQPGKDGKKDPSESSASKGDDQKRPPSDRPPQDSQPQTGGDVGDDSGKADKSDSPASKSSLPKDKAETREYGEGEGPEWDGLGDEKQFKDSVIDAKNEKLDARYTGKESELRRNPDEAKVKTSLEDVLLARPETQKGKDSQPIPLEYQDLLK